MRRKVRLKLRKHDIHKKMRKHENTVARLSKEAESMLKRYRVDTGPLLDKKGDVIRVPTGIIGLDSIIEGGIPKGSIVLLTGPCGTGKSILGLEFLVKGALRGEPGVYVSLEESLDETLNQMRFFGWPVDELLKEKKLMIIEPELYNFNTLLSAIEDSITKIKATRLVIDSLSVIGMYFDNPFEIRKSLMILNQMIKNLGCTTLAISEVAEAKEQLSPYGVEEYVSDGVILLYYIRRGGSFSRSITIRKMRTTDHSIKVHPIEIKRHKGIIVYNKEEAMQAKR